MATIALMLLSLSILQVDGANWCVARSDASNQALQTAIDYACASGADCTPILSNGLCFLPNTIQAHSSYAFNSYFQRKAMAPGSCDFSGTATVATTDPSYGSCVYPSSLSTAGGTPTNTSTTTNSPTTTITTPSTTTTTPLYNGGGIGVNPGLSPPMPNDSKASSRYMDITTLLMSISSFWLLLLSFTLPHI
ncbi:hypothetical protein Dsin_027437 [Dipteronia sinensis]|uniref:X8 domain-containing protein n=1 Tax=Dipteronia sinensis TaxID=43782 RepID=A0AAD9ZQ69_9ROSI|nr:hypothetical protein Dsin_027437 [Dipteronia sinensis]